jgi:hypothetical protein
VTRRAGLATSLALVAVLAGCSAVAPVPTPTTGPQRATVTDLSAPLASSESGALVSRGFLGNADLGRVGIGCQVEVVKATDRAVQVKLVSCPDSNETNVTVGTQGWVAKSALDLKP